ncbi:MAG: hypothetical protein ACLUVV_04285, partial [Christensenellales bacterium]
AGFDGAQSVLSAGTAPLAIFGFAIFFPFFPAILFQERPYVCHGLSMSVYKGLGMCREPICLFTLQSIPKSGKINV